MIEDTLGTGNVNLASSLDFLYLLHMSCVCQLECISFVFKVKTGPFAEHSNQLWNISGVPHWEKVNSGLVKMYKAEVSILNRPLVKCV